MKKVLVVIVCLLLITGCSKTTSIDNPTEENNMTTYLIINNQKYKVELENNKTTKELIKHLPLELDSKELNGNEKYNYLDFKLPTNSYHPDEIKAGDIMLYNDDCLVLFYDNFKTSYSYTKIGHVNIDNIQSVLGNKNVKIIITQE